LRCIEDNRHCLHTFEDVFLLGGAANTAKGKANALRTELVKKPKVDEETNAETWTPSKTRRAMNSLRHYISHEIDFSKQFNAGLNFPKIHLMSQSAAKVCWYGALQRYSADRHAQAPKMNLEDGSNASNHNLNYLSQVITFRRRILCFESWELNVQALPQGREKSAATCKVLPSGCDLAAPMSPQSDAKYEFMAPQHRRD